MRTLYRRGEPPAAAGGHETRQGERCRFVRGGSCSCSRSRWPLRRATRRRTTIREERREVRHDLRSQRPERACCERHDLRVGGGDRRLDPREEPLRRPRNVDRHLRRRGLGRPVGDGRVHASGRRPHDLPADLELQPRTAVRPRRGRRAVPRRGGGERPGRRGVVPARLPRRPDGPQARARRDPAHDAEREPVRLVRARHRVAGGARIPWPGRGRLLRAVRTISGARSVRTTRSARSCPRLAACEPIPTYWSAFPYRELARALRRVPADDVLHVSGSGREAPPGTRRRTS